MQITSNTVYGLQAAIELVKLRARVPIIETLLSGTGIDKKTIAALYEEHNNKKSPKGQLPYQLPFYVNTHQRRLESSFLVVLYSRLRNNGIGHADAMIQSYKQYLEVFEDNPAIEFDRYWILQTLISTNSLLLRSCPECKSGYVDDASERVDVMRCPCCWFASKKARRKADIHQTERPQRYTNSSRMAAIAF